MAIVLSPIRFELLRKKRYGLDKIIHELEGMILNSKHLDNRFYQLWLGLTEYKKEHFKADVRNLIRKELLGKEFTKAIAESVIRNGEVDTKNPMYRYLKNKVYHGNVRLMLSDLQSYVREK